MKLKAKITTFGFVILILNSFICFGKTEVFVERRQVVEPNHTIQTSESQTNKENNFWHKYIYPQIASFVAVLVSWFALTRQIKATKKDKIHQDNFKIAVCLLKNISKLLLEIHNDDGSFGQGKYISDNHFLYEQQVLLLLDLRNDSEKQLSDYIRSISDGTINNQSIQQAIKEINEKAIPVIYNKIKSL